MLRSRVLTVKRVSLPDITAPSACFANLPVSSLITRPSGRAISFVTIFICFSSFLVAVCDRLIDWTHKKSRKGTNFFSHTQEKIAFCSKNTIFYAEIGKNYPFKACKRFCISIISSRRKAAISKSVALAAASICLRFCSIAFVKV